MFRSPMPSFRPTLVALLAASVLVPCGASGQPSPSPARPAPPPSSTTPRAAATPPPAGYRPPKPLQRTPLSYPELAKLNRITGVLRLLLTVDEAGRVTDTALLTGSGSLLLDQAAFDPGIRNWTFQPATLEGRPVTGTYEQELEFKLDPEEQRGLLARRATLLPTAGTPDPPYPDAARAKALRGRTTLVVTWGDTGLVERIGLQQSSGSGLLDVTALRWAYEQWRVDRGQFKEPQFVKTIVFDPDRPERAAALANQTPPPLGTFTPPPVSTPAPTPTPRKR